MKFVYSLLFLSCLASLSACKKEKGDDDDDKRHKFLGHYKTATGPATYAANAFGTIWSSSGRDTATFSIIMPQHTDSTDYIYLSGVKHQLETYRPGQVGFSSLRFANNGTPVPAKVSDSTFVIDTHPFDANGNSMALKGSGSVDRNGVLTLSYYSWYRGYSKIAVLTLRR